MPWKSEDAEKHHKNLTPEQKKKWASTANAVLAECQKKGGDDCEGKAIRIANVTVNNNSQPEIINVNFTQLAYSAEIKVWDEKQYYVVPVVMMVEGVHNGSRGPLFHSADELGKVEAAWNGIPVTVGHPLTDDDMFISANSPEILSSWSVGKVFNTRMENGKLKAEAWLDIERLKIISPETLRLVQSGQIMEVSVGIFSDEDEVEGVWNSENYIAVARNYRPDHLALLPGEIGACSVEDGCGLRVNSGTVTTTYIGDDVSSGGTVTVDDSQDMEQLDNQLEKIDNKNGVHIMCEVCKEKVKELIAHESTHFTEDDREWLEALTEDKLDKLIPKLIQVDIKVPTVEEAWNIIKGVTPEDYIAHIPDEVKVQINNEFKMKEERQAITQSILANSKEWEETELTGMSLNVLKKLEATTKSVVTNYSIRGIRGNVNEQGIAPMPLPGVKFEN